MAFSCGAPTPTPSRATPYLPTNICARWSKSSGPLRISLKTADLPRARRDHPQPRVLQLSLSLVLKKALEDRVTALGRSSSWSQIVTDFHSVTETDRAREETLCGLPGVGSRRHLPLCGRRHAAAHPLIPPNPQCGAKPLAQHTLLLPINHLANRAVEDPSKFKRAISDGRGPHELNVAFHFSQLHTADVLLPG
jgi:hypothetical protein